MKVGDVFVADLGANSHRHVVVGKNEFSTLLLVTATSQIEKRKRHIQKTSLTYQGSLIEIETVEYQSNKNPEKCSLTKPTCFDCNGPNSIHKIHSGYILCSPVSEELFKKLKNAVRNSPAVDQHTKDNFLQ